VQTISAHAEGVTCAKLGVCTGQVLATGGSDGKVNLWKVGRAARVLGISAAKTAVRCVGFDADETVVVAGSRSGSLRLFALNAEGKTQCRLTGHNSECTAACFHPLGNLLVSGGADANVKVWDIRTKSCMRTFMGHEEKVTCLEFSPDGKWVASGSSDKTVKLWDLQTGKMLHDFNAHRGVITSLKFHPAEFWLATGSEDSTVKYWDLESFKSVGSTPVDRGNSVKQINFLEMDADSATGQRNHSLVSATSEGVRVWSMQPCRCLSYEPTSWGPLEDSVVTQDRFGAQKLIACTLKERTMVSIWSVGLETSLKEDDEEERVEGYEDIVVEEIEEVVEDLDDESKEQEEKKSEALEEKEATCENKATPRDSSGARPRSRKANRSRPNENSKVEVNVFGQWALREGPLDLTMSDFMGGEKKAAHRPVTSSTIRADSKLKIVEEVEKKHKEFYLVMMERTRILERILDKWRSQNTAAAFEGLEKCKDAGVLYDFFRCVNFKSGQSTTLDICGSLLPILITLVESKFEVHIKMGLSLGKFLFDSFNKIIVTTLEHNRKKGARAAVDISAEDRAHKCRKCARHFFLLGESLSKLKQSTSIASNMARTKADVEILSERLNRFLDQLPKQPTAN